MISSGFFGALARIYPPGRLLTRTAELAPYESDGLTAFRVRPGGVVLPTSADEVIETVRLCHRFGVPFVARGSGTSLSGGSVPIEDGLLIGLNKMNRILQYDPQERIAVVEPGVINQRASQISVGDGLYYAPDPSSAAVCTIGGNVAFNSGGAHCLKYGMTSNHVLGIKGVLPDGEVVQFGGPSLEQVGTDLLGMFVGSEGLFGCALEITLRLLPKPEKYYTLQAAYRSLEEAGNAVSMVVASGLLPGALEIMDRLAMNASDAAVQANYPKDAQAILIVELEGPIEEVDAETPLLQKLIDDSGAYRVDVAKNAAERLKIWTGRKCAFSAVGRLSPDFIVQDGVVPRTKLGEALARIDEISRQSGIPVANVFHAGDGNLHPLILFDGRTPGALERAEEVAAEILRLCIKLGGSITGEHGVGLEKRAFFEEMFGKKDTDLMRRIRDAIDPGQIANRGKMLPDTSAPALTHRGLHPVEKQGLAFRS
ncbi:FAD-binding protein [bacterium]|nr:FAD-binding protein [bacterium]